MNTILKYAPTEPSVARIDLTLIGLLASFRRLYRFKKLLSDVLQSPLVDKAMAVDVVRSFVHTLQVYRTKTLSAKPWHCRDIQSSAK